jgi:hypothetical protein
MLLVAAGLLAGSPTRASSADDAHRSGNVASLPGTVALAVLGDSDSHSFHDRVSFPPSSGMRGGVFRDSTWQWTELLGRLRSNEINLGPWGTWGTRGRIAIVREWLGLDGRAPRKEDYQYNFATSGAGCENLLTGMARQAPRLLTLMDREPQRWRNGVVVLRIGVNSFGMDDALDALARDPGAPAVQAIISQCVGYVRDTVALIHTHHPGTRIVLVGIFDNSHWPNYFGRWQSARQLDNIRQGLDRYDNALKAMAASDLRLAFFDDRAWFAQRWGGRDGRGRPAYKTVTLSSGFQVTNSKGDYPSHAVIADGHAGAAFNALWAQSLIALVNARFGFHITPISDAEVARAIVAPSTPKFERR